MHVLFPRLSFLLLTICTFLLFQAHQSKTNLPFSTAALKMASTILNESKRDEKDQEIVTSFIDFLNEAVSPFHAVQAAKDILMIAGFIELNEADGWEGQISPGGKYFFTRNYSTIVAFAVGNDYKPDGTSGFTIVGAHTDSPCPKLKPVSNLKKGGFEMLNVQPYGGGLWHTWFDRDLSVAGRAVVRRGGGGGGGGGYEHRLVRVPRALLRISTLAIHLTSAEERKGFAPNLQNHFVPALATEAREKLWAEGAGAAATAAAAATEDGRHSPLLLSLLAEELGCDAGDIEDFELAVCDTQPSATGGAFDEFVFSGRLDNLCSSFQAIRALVDSSESLASEPNIRLAFLFDHEEIGSVSAVGAAGAVSVETLRRVAGALRAAGAGGAAAAAAAAGPDAFERALRRSFVVSSDMAHACHPNYADKHDPQLKPKVGGGMVLKHNANQRYATNAVGAFLFREIGRRAGLPTQEFAVRSDSGCGSTIGPVTAGLTGINVVDVGSPQLSMHSVRETMSAADVVAGYKHLKAVYETFPLVNNELSVDGHDAKRAKI